MLSFFVVIASFAAVDQPAVQHVNWRMSSRAECEANLNDLLLAYKIDFDVQYDILSEERLFTTESLPTYKGETRLHCVEITANR
jgi:hypothetical protein